MVDTTRPGWDEVWMNVAREMAKRGTCLRRSFGVIIVDKDNVFLSSGYTGAPRGTPNCCDIGKCLRNDFGIAHGERYELCRSVHAEMNAVINAARNGIMIPPGSKMYIFEIDKEGSFDHGRPCLLCRRIIINLGISEVVFTTKEGHKTEKVADWVEMSNKDIGNDFK